MKAFNVFRKTAVASTAIGFFFVGLVCCLVGGVFIGAQAGRTYEKTQATVLSFRTVRNYSDDSISYYVTVEYTVDGQVYQAHDLSIATRKQEGDRITVYYDVNNPQDTQTSSSQFIPYIFFAVGLAVMIGAAVGAVRGIKNHDADVFEDATPQNGALFSEEEFAGDFTGGDTYFFHYDNNYLHQGHVLEDASHRIVYEALMKKASLFRPYEFDFVNHYAGVTRSYQIGHTVTVSVGSGNRGFHTGVPVSSSFTIDGKKNWQYLQDLGCTIAVAPDLMHPVFTVKRYGEPVAVLERTGTVQFEDRDYGKIGNAIGSLPANGFYQVRCRTEDLDIAFLVCVCLTRGLPD